MDLLSEEDQWEALKSWLRRNGGALVAGVAIGVLALLGWRWWNERAETRAVDAATRYEQLLSTLDAGNLDQALTQLDALKAEHKDSAYAAPAELALAKFHVARNELDKAAERLDSVAKSATDERLRPIARLRLARVQVSQAKYDEALATLGQAAPAGHEAGYAEVRGDALFYKGDKAGALREYEAAAAALSAQGPNAAGELAGSLLQLKIDDLRAELPAAAPAAAPAPAPGATTDAKG